MDDAIIIALYFKRSEEAIVETRNKYGRMLLSLAFGILRNKEDASECENDTYMKTWNAIPPAQPNALSAFLSRIARNLALDRFRRACAQKRGSGEVPAMLDELAACIPDSNAETEMNDTDLREVLNQFLAAAREEPRIMFMQRYWFGYSTAEIAQRHGCKEAKVKMSLLRTRKALKQRLEQEGYRI